MIKLKTLRCITLVLLIALVSRSSASDFIPLGDFAAGLFSSGAAGISADATTVVGSGSLFDSPANEAFRWTFAEGLHRIQNLPPIDAPQSIASSVSGDGTLIVGSTDSQIPALITEAFRWSVNTGVVGLGFLPGTTSLSSRANDVSTDGNTIVGFSSSRNGFSEAFRWTVSTGMIGLGDFPGGPFGDELSDFVSFAEATSRDGSVIVGGGSSMQGTEAFRWTDSDGLVGLGDLPGGRFSSFASDVSADGQIVVGSGASGASDSWNEAFRWSQQEGIQPLGDLAGGLFHSEATAVSSDGSVVFGFGWTSNDYLDRTGQRAFVWEAVHGLRDFQQVLMDEYDLSNGLLGWQLATIGDVSEDGMSIVGTGINPNGNDEAWLVRLDHPIGIPEPHSFTIALVSLTLLRLNRRRRRIA